MAPACYVIIGILELLNYRLTYFIDEVAVIIVSFFMLPRVVNRKAMI